MSKRIVKDLRRAQRLEWPVTIYRKKLKKTEHLDGFVLEVGEDWLLVAALTNSVYLDGWEILRIADVTKIVFGSDDFEDYIGRALTELGDDRRAPQGLTVATTGMREAIRLVLEAAPLVGVYCEARYPGELYVGSVIGTRKKRLGLQFINSRGRWDDYWREFKLADVTRVTIGGRYNDALERFGDARPALTFK